MSVTPIKAIIRIASSLIDDAARAAISCLALIYLNSAYPRSFGIPVVVSAQWSAAPRVFAVVVGSEHGPDPVGLRCWFGMIGTKIITRINASEAAEDISRLIGELGVRTVHAKCDPRWGPSF